MKNKFSAVIFDLDGTILDNEGEWEVAFQAVISQNKLDISEKFRLANGWFHEPGIGVVTNWKKWILDPQKAEEYAMQTKDWYTLKDIEPKEIQVRVGVDEVLERIKEMSFLTALGTSSTWTMVEEELEQLSLLLAFDVTTTGEEVLAPKPDPEIYLLTAQKLGLEPEECLVIEDAVAGVRAGVEAGCKVIGLVSDYAPADILKAAGATWTVEDFSECATILIEENRSDTDPVE